MIELKEVFGFKITDDMLAAAQAALIKGTGVIRLNEDGSITHIPHEEIYKAFTVKADDLPFIAHSREDVPFLLDLCEKQARALEFANRALKKVSEYPFECNGDHSVLKIMVVDYAIAAMAEVLK